MSSLSQIFVRSQHATIFCFSWKQQSNITAENLVYPRQSFESIRHCANMATSGPTQSTSRNATSGQRGYSNSKGKMDSASTHILSQFNVEGPHGSWRSQKYTVCELRQWIASPDSIGKSRRGENEVERWSSQWSTRSRGEFPRCWCPLQRHVSQATLASSVDPGPLLIALVCQPFENLC